MAAITVDELSTYMQRAFTADQERVAAVILDGVQAELESWCGKPLTLTTVTDEQASGRGKALFLAKRPVVSVQQVRVGTDIIDPTLYRVRSFGLDQLDFVALFEQPLYVTYTAGIDAANNPLVRWMILRAAAREMARAVDQAQGVERVSVEGYSASYLDLWTESELKRAGRLRRRVIA